MQKYILYSVLTIFAFSSVSLGIKEDKEDSSNVTKRGVEKPLWERDWEVLTQEKRPVQTHLSPYKEYPLDSSYSRGKTVYVLREKAQQIIFEKNPQKPSGETK